MIFYLVIIATLINQIAFKGSKVLMSLYAMNLGADPFIVGALISLYFLFPLFLAVYAGRLSDRSTGRNLRAALPAKAAVRLPSPHLFHLTGCPILL